MNALFAEQMMIVFSILAIGAWLGHLSLKGVSLGSAGVLFVALIFGHFGQRVPKEITDLGLLLFVYAVGLQAGPRFFRTFRQHGRQFVVIGLCSVLTGAVLTFACARILHLPFDLAAGLYTGAMTCTPALAAATDSVGRVLGTGHLANVSVGYGIAYPYSMLGVVLLIQALPKLLRRNVHHEEALWREEQTRELPSLEVRRFRITNPNCHGKNVEEINPNRMVLVNISRVQRAEKVLVATHDTVLHQDDIVTAVGAEEELQKMELLLGEETQETLEQNVNADIASVDVEITSDAIGGHSIRDMFLEDHAPIVITRVRRQGEEITPRGRLRLEVGDTVRVVGEKEAVEAFTRRVGAGHHKDDTNMVTFLIGLMIGVAVGTLPVHLPGGMTVRLGIAGGAFLVSLVIGHFGRIGRFQLQVPPAAKNLSREFGLMLFLAGAGTSAGSRFVQVLQQQGVSLLLVGMLVTTASVLVSLFLTHRFYRMNLLQSMGVLCACMTNPPGLSAAVAQTETDLPTLAYASVYPVALIFKILLVQALVEVLRRHF